MVGYLCPECKLRPATATILENREILAQQTSDKLPGEYRVVICQRCLSQMSKGDLWTYIRPDGGTEIFYLRSREHLLVGSAA
jgi:hypothetical protein